MLAEVLDIFYKDTVLDDVAYPAGTVYAVIVPDNGINSIMLEIYALPASNIKKTPLAGEFIHVFQGPGYSTVLVSDNPQYYYDMVLNIKNNIDKNTNSDTYVRIATDATSRINDYKFSQNPNIASNGPQPGISIQEDTISNSPMYEGDTLYEGRLGNKIRLGSTGRDTDLSKYDVTPEYNGIRNQISPITIISNDAGNESYKSGTNITLSSNQQFPTLGYRNPTASLQIVPIRLYNKPQIILNSDRIVINSNADNIILTTDNTVSISTKNWNTDYNTVMNNIESLIQQVQTIVNILNSSAASGFTAAAATTAVTQLIPVNSNLINIRTQLGLMKR